MGDGSATVIPFPPKRLRQCGERYCWNNATHFLVVMDLDTKEWADTKYYCPGCAPKQALKIPPNAD